MSFALLFAGEWTCSNLASAGRLHDTTLHLSFVLLMWVSSGSVLTSTGHARWWQCMSWGQAQVLVVKSVPK
eukprot:2895064-Amphidinium_carterae.4